MAKKRLAELSYLNLLLYLLVIFIHVSAEPVSRLNRDSLQYLVVVVPWRLSAFVVQGFFFLSGVKLCLGAKEPFDAPHFWLRRVRTVVLPYVAWVFLYYCWFCRHGYFSFRLEDLGGYLLRGDLVSPFYFVVTIVQFYLLAPLFLRAVERLRPALLLAGSLVVMVVLWKGLPQLLRLASISEDFRYTDRVFTTYLFYFTAGCVAGKHYAAFCAWLRKRRLPLCLTFGLLGVGDVWIYGRLLPVVGGFFADLFHMGYCVAAIAALLSLALLLAERGMPPAAAAMDAVTYPVFLCHSLIIFWLNDKMTALGLCDLAYRFLLRTVVVYPTAFALCLLWRRGKSWLKMRWEGRNR